MCGLSGFFAHTQLGPWFADVLDVIRHRGPDGDGVWTPGHDRVISAASLRDQRPVDVPAALGQLRLSILDLSPSGAQPMVVPGQAAVVTNGEIYNFVELRQELQDAGWSFVGTSDTEVLLKGWLQWGIDLLPRMNGMWAFALWDERRHGMLLSRDRFGEKPLFLADWRGGLAFASEIKALLRFPGISASLDEDRVGRFLLSGRAYDGPSTWFEGIRQLEPGTALWIDASGRTTYRYYDLEHAVGQVESGTNPTEWADRLDRALDDSVRIRLRSDVALGGCLSEGVDSSVIATTAVRHPLSRPYQAFTLGSDDPLIDERRGAEALAGRIGSLWHGSLARADEFVRLFDRIIWHQETPISATSLYGQWRVFEEARATGVPVLLDGQGADEILAGYTKFFAAHVRTAVRSNPLTGAREAARLARHLGAAPKLLRYAHRYLPSTKSGPDIRAVLRNPPASDDLMPDVRRGVFGMRIDDIRRWSLPNLLSYEDRNAMAHSVETRLPYLDPSVVELSLAMPESVLFNDGWTKWPLREVLARRGAPEVAWRRAKRQFFVPQASWLRTELTPMLTELRTNPHPSWNSLVDRGALSAFLDGWTTQPSGSASDEACFQLLAIDRFLRTFFP